MNDSIENKSYNISKNINCNILLSAIYFASMKHKNQTRKNDNTPFINHPLEVMYFLKNIGKINNELVLASAVLHDTIEDTDTRYEDLVKDFNKDIANLVFECTDDKRISKSNRKEIQRKMAGERSIEAQQIKLADKISNMSSMLDSIPKNWDMDRAIGYVIWSKLVCDNMQDSSFELYDFHNILFYKFFDKYNVNIPDDINVFYQNYLKNLK